MCIIAVKPADTEISTPTLRNMWVNNPHGAGIMYAKNGKLRVIKGLMTFPQFMSSYRRVKAERLVIHYRWRTHGAVSRDLTHPFWITEGSLGMVHNGIILGANPKRNESDTSAYAKILRKRHANPMEAIENTRNLVPVLIEIGMSKLVFMNAEGKVRIVNPQMGHFNNEVWFSNHSYTDPKTYAKTYGELDYDPGNWKISIDLLTI